MKIFSYLTVAAFVLLASVSAAPASEDFFLPDCCSVCVAGQRFCSSGLRRCTYCARTRKMLKMLMLWIKGHTFETFVMWTSSTSRMHLFSQFIFKSEIYV